ncbi:MAG: universal stress protein [Thermodesulfobacteriota bacterium]|nr:universal stress protein [Thermodesulfobacteriota bacterium]
MVEIKKILFPCDLTEHTSKILPYVLSISEKYNSMIYILHVVDDISKWCNVSVPHVSANLFLKEVLSCSKESLEKFCNEQLKDIPNVQRKIAVGYPATEILKTIESAHIDLVIMGTHGRKGLEHMIFGSVAEHVLKKSSVPVLIINPYKIK